MANAKATHPPRRSRVEAARGAKSEPRKKEAKRDHRELDKVKGTSQAGERGWRCGLEETRKSAVVEVAVIL